MAHPRSLSVLLLGVVVGAGCSRKEAPAEVPQASPVKAAGPTGEPGKAQREGLPEAVGRPDGGQTAGQQQMPDGALAACSGRAADAECSFKGGDGVVKGKCGEGKEKRLVCRDEGHQGAEGSASPEVYKSTKLPLRATGLRLGKGGEATITVGAGGALKPSCSGMSLGSLTLGKQKIPLKSNKVTSNCMIQTEEYGDVKIKIDVYNFSYNILITEKQQDLFSQLVPAK